jgi:hypothetical protein
VRTRHVRATEARATEARNRNEEFTCFQTGPAPAPFPASSVFPPRPPPMADLAAADLAAADRDDLYVDQA